MLNFHSRSAVAGRAYVCVKVSIVRLLWSALVLLSLLNPRPTSAQSAPTVRTLYLVRHGFCDYQDRDDKVGNALLPLGREQAALVGDRLVRFPIKFTAITSSEFTRGA